MPETVAKRVDGLASIDTSTICYGKRNDDWFIYFPEMGLVMLTDQEKCNWHITENPDGTITADPSIRVTRGEKMRHGWLRNGVWDSCTDEVL